MTKLETKTKERESSLVIKIKKLDINESYFFGIAEIEGKEFKINIQGEWKEKLIKLPVKLEDKDKVLVNLSGKEDSFVDDILYYGGLSEWIEIDSNHILYYLADNQDKIDTLEIFL